MKVPSGFFTSTLSPPGRTPSSAATDWAIQSAGKSKLTVFAGSENVFHDVAVGTAWGSPEVVADAVADAAVLPAGAADVALPVDAVPEDTVPEEAVADGSGCAVQPGAAWGPEHPASRTAVAAMAIPERKYIPERTAFAGVPVMGPSLAGPHPLSSLPLRCFVHPPVRLRPAHEPAAGCGTCPACRRRTFITPAWD